MKSFINIFIIILIAFTISIFPINVELLSFDFFKPIEKSKIETPIDKTSEVEEKIIVEYSYDLPDKVYYIENPKEINFSITFTPSIENNIIKLIDKGLRVDFYQNDEKIKSISSSNLKFSIKENKHENFTDRIYKINIEKEYSELVNGNYTLHIYSDYKDLKNLKHSNIDINIFNPIEYNSAIVRTRKNSNMTTVYYLNKTRDFLIPITRTLPSYDKFIRNTLNQLVYNPPSKDSGLSTDPTSPVVINIYLRNKVAKCYITKKDAQNFLTDGKFPQIILDSIAKSLLGLNSVDAISFEVAGKDMETSVKKVYSPKLYLSYIADNNRAYLVPYNVKESEDLITILFNGLKNLDFAGASDSNLSSTIPMNIELTNYTVKDNMLNLTFSKNFLDAYNSDQKYFSLMMDSIINTFTSIKGIDMIGINIDGVDIFEKYGYNFEKPFYQRKYINPLDI